MKTLKIFLASSNELQTEREMMAALANSLNTVLEKQGVNVIVVQWENLDASMGVNHKQDDYNEKLRECDMCMVLYWTKFGMYTKIELETAFNELKAGHNPKKVYVYFKEDDSKVSDELKVFRDSFPTKYGHFYTPFSNFDTLKAHFLLQFMEYQSQILPEGKGVEMRNGKVTIDGVEYVDLKNVPFAENNENRQELLEEIRETEEDLSDMDPESPRYAKKQEKLSKLQDKLRKVEEGLWATAMTITRLRTQACTERLKRAMELFEGGDSKGADAILDEDDIIRDAERNVRLIETASEGLKTSISEIQLKIRLLSCNEFDASEANLTYDRKEKLYKDLIKYISLVYGQNSEELLDVYHEAGLDFSHTRQSIRSIFFLEKELELAKILRPGRSAFKCRQIISRLIRVCKDYSKWDKATEYEHEKLLLLKDTIGEESSDFLHELLRYAKMLWNTGKPVENLYKEAESIALKLGENYPEQVAKAEIQYHISQGKLDNAISVAEKPQNKEYRDSLVEECFDSLCENNDVSGCLELLSKTTKTISPQERLSKYLQAAERLANRTGKALRVYDEAITLAEELHDNSALSSIFYKRAEIWFRLSDWTRYLKCVETALEYNPDSNSAWVQAGLAKAHRRLNNSEKAIEHARLCLSMMDSEDLSDDQNLKIDAYELLRDCYVAIYDAEMAIQYQRKIVDGHPREWKRMDNLLRLAGMYARYGFSDLSIKCCQDILIDKEEELSIFKLVRIYDTIALAYFQCGDHINAELYYKKNLDICLRALNPEWQSKQDHSNVCSRIVRAYSNLAWIYIHGGKYDRAQECLDEIPKYDKKYNPEKDWIQGVICRERGEFQRAVDIFHADRYMNPLFCQSEIIRTLIKWGKIDEAQESLSSIYDEFKDEPPVHELQGMIHKESGKNHEALDEFNRCMELRKIQYLPEDSDLTRIIEDVKENIRKNG